MFVALQIVEVEIQECPIDDILEVIIGYERLKK